MYLYQALIWVGRVILRGHINYPTQHMVHPSLHMYDLFIFMMAAQSCHIKEADSSGKTYADEERRRAGGPWPRPPFKRISWHRNQRQPVHIKPCSKIHLALRDKRSTGKLLTVITHLAWVDLICLFQISIAEPQNYSCTIYVCAVVTRKCSVDRWSLYTIKIKPESWGWIFYIDILNRWVNG